MRTDRYRLTLWQDRKNPERLHGVELYDHASDRAENVNLAGSKEHVAVEQRLRKQFQESWQR